jgi:hypothetical protein
VNVNWIYSYMKHFLLVCEWFGFLKHEIGLLIDSGCIIGFIFGPEFAGQLYAKA